MTAQTNQRILKTSEIKKGSEEVRDVGLSAASVLPHKNFPSAEHEVSAVATIKADFFMKPYRNLMAEEHKRFQESSHEFYQVYPTIISHA